MRVFTDGKEKTRDHERERGSSGGRSLGGCEVKRVCRHLGRESLCPALPSTSLSYYVRGLQAHPGFMCCFFSRKTHTIHSLVTLLAKIYYSKRIQSPVSKGKLGTSFQECYSYLVIQDTIPPATTSDSMEDAILQGSVTETQCPGVLLGVGHIAPSYAHTGSPLMVGTLLKAKFPEANLVSRAFKR